jgi:hypothetical protein
MMGQSDDYSHSVAQMVVNHYLTALRSNGGLVVFVFLIGIPVYSSSEPHHHKRYPCHCTSRLAETDTVT